MGYGILEINDKTPVYINAGVLKLPATEEHFQKLGIIFNRTVELINEYQITEFAIEAPFYGNNVQSMLKLGRAQGSAITAALHMNLNINEYSPRKVKQSITGKGAADKTQVAAMLVHLLGLKIEIKPLDATDALGVAYCHYLQSSRPTISGSTSSGWSAFIKNNPGRIK